MQSLRYSGNESVVIKSVNINYRETTGISKNEERLGYTTKYTDVKNKIDKIDIKTWNQVRRYTNNFEFPLKRNNGNSYNPISRAFFKMWEMIQENKYLCESNLKEEFKVLCLAEAPGGFVQAINKYLYDNDNERDYKIYTMSLISEANDSSIPVYSRDIIENSKVQIIKGVDNRGDIYNPENLLNVKDVLTVGGGKSNLITADGGFNENNQFNIKEQLHYKLFLSEIVSAIMNQAYQGNFVIKFFDIYTRFSLDLIYILMFFYEDLEIYKPLTSRPTNSEKYIICKSFKKLTEQHKKIIKKLLSIIP